MALLDHNTQTKDAKMENFGTVKYDGKELPITQQPYICREGQSLYYKATAEDEDGFIFDVRWPVIWDDEKRDYVDFEDESEMCDWSDYDIYPQYDYVNYTLARKI